MDERANLRDMAYNQMKMQYSDARSSGTAKFLLPAEANEPAKARKRQASPANGRGSRRRARSVAGRRHPRPRVHR